MSTQTLTRRMPAVPDFVGGLENSPDDIQVTTIDAPTAAWCENCPLVAEFSFSPGQFWAAASCLGLISTKLQSEKVSRVIYPSFQLFIRLSEISQLLWINLHIQRGAASTKVSLVLSSTQVFCLHPVKRPSTMFRWHRRRHNNNLRYNLAYGESDLEIWPENITEIILADHALRELKQREEALHHRVTALQKAKTLESDSSEFDNASEQLEKTRAQVPGKEYELYRAVSMLDPYFKHLHHDLRDNAQWFMRQDMVRDCSDRGGCCSRNCGCCSHRQLFKGTKGDGHCTTECWCCTVFRGFELSADEKEAISKDLRDRLKAEESGYLLTMANSFFCPLPKRWTPALERSNMVSNSPTTASTPSKSKSRWQRIFGRGSADEKND